MPTVEEVFEQNQRFFGVVPHEDRSYVCPYCLGPVGDYHQCYNCLELFIQGDVPQSLRGRVVPMTSCLNPSPWYRRLYTYKHGRPDYGPILASLTLIWLRQHLDEIEELLGGSASVTTIVPSTRGPDFESQRLRQSLSLAPPIRESLRHALSHVDGESVNSNEYNPDAFEAGPVSVGGERVLLIEDTWLTGATALSAAGALLREGAEQVVITPLARSSFENNCIQVYAERMVQDYDPTFWPRTPGRRIL